MTKQTTAVVIGAGYAGVMAANRLTRRPDVQVWLINPRTEFVERIRLHQLLSRTHTARHDLRSVLADRVHLRTATVTRIDAATRRLDLDDGEQLDYDYLVYAVGSTSSATHLPGADQHAYRVGSLAEAEQLRRALESTAASAPVVVIGGGPTGIETAAELAEAGRTVTLLCGGPLGPTLHPRARRTLARRLQRLGVQVLEGGASLARAVTADAVELTDGRRLPSALSIQTAGFGVPDLAARSGLSTDAVGRLRTDETLTSIDDQHIVAAGDAAAPSGLPVRMSCQAAVQLGPQAAETVLRRIAGEPARPIGVSFVALCLSVGRRAGLLQSTRRDDRATAAYVGGRPGAAIKELICSGTLTQLRFEARHPGLVDGWMTDPRRTRRLQSRSAAEELSPDR